MTPSGLRSTQYAILAELNRKREEPPTLQQLADALVMDRSALGHTLRPLERDGWIVIEAGEADRRRRHLSLTDAGFAKYREARPMWSAAQKRFHGVIGDGEAKALRDRLLAIAHDDRLSSLGG